MTFVIIYEDMEKGVASVLCYSTVTGDNSVSLPDTRSFICKPFSCFLTRDYDVFYSAQPDLLHMT